MKAGSFVILFITAIVAGCMDPSPAAGDGAGKGSAETGDPQADGRTAGPDAATAPLCEADVKASGCVAKTSPQTLAFHNCTTTPNSFSVPVQDFAGRLPSGYAPDESLPGIAPMNFQTDHCDDLVADNVTVIDAFHLAFVIVLVETPDEHAAPEGSTDLFLLELLTDSPAFRDVLATAGIPSTLAKFDTMDTTVAIAVDDAPHYEMTRLGGVGASIERASGTRWHFETDTGEVARFDAEATGAFGGLITPGTIAAHAGLLSEIGTGATTGTHASLSATMTSDFTWTFGIPGQATQPPS